MYDFILQTILILSLTVITFLFARALPRVEEESAGPGHADLLDHWLGRLPLEKMDAFVNSLFSKSLRRLRVIVLKLDNLIHGWLQKVKKASGNGNGNGQLL